MNKRICKKKSKRIRKQIHEVLDLVLDINGLQKNDEKNHPTAFMTFSGHIGEISTYFYSDGYYLDDYPDIEFKSTVFEGSMFKIPEIIEQLRKYKIR